MRNFAEKRTWVRLHKADRISDAEVVSEFAKCFGIRNEDKAALEVQELLEADIAIQKDFGEVSRERYIMQGEAVMGDMLKAGAYGPASAMWRSISQAKGFERQSVQVEVGPSPEMTETIRARMASLLANDRIRERAEEAGLAEEVGLDQQAQAQSAWLSDGKRNPLYRPSEPTEAAPASEPSSPSELPVPSAPASASERTHQPPDPPDHVVASHVASVLCTMTKK